MSPEKDIREIAEMVYREHYPTLLDRALRMTAGSMDLARDAVMDIFRDFIKNEWVIEERNIKHYFLVAVTRRCIELLIRERKGKNIEKTYQGSTDTEYTIGPSEPHLLDNADSLFSKIRTAINQLDPKYKEVIELSMQGYWPTDIAAKLGIGNMAATGLKSAAVRKLKKILNS